MSRTTHTLSGRLVRCAARTAPGSLSARLEEEWLADLHERTSRASRLRFATLRVCVDPTGRLTSDPVTQESSGSDRLDSAAIRLAKAGSGHYRPSTDDGRPVNSCYPVKIRFQLKR
jgi:TonB family protein